MGIVLGVPYEAYSRGIIPSHIHPYCEANPLVYFDLGFATGVPLVKLEIALNGPDSDPLIQNFVALCNGTVRYENNGKILSFRGSGVDSIDSLHGIVILGETLPAVGHSYGHAANESGTVKSAPGSSLLAPAGSVVMLPRDTDASEFSSVFFVTTQKMTIFDGKLIGNELCYMVEHFGSANGAPQKPMFVHDCGQI